MFGVVIIRGSKGMVLVTRFSKPIKVYVRRDNNRNVLQQIMPPWEAAHDGPYGRMPLYQEVS